MWGSLLVAFMVDSRAIYVMTFVLGCSWRCPHTMMENRDEIRSNHTDVSSTFHIKAADDRSRGKVRAGAVVLENLVRDSAKSGVCHGERRRSPCTATPTPTRRSLPRTFPQSHFPTVPKLIAFTIPETYLALTNARFLGAYSLGVRN